MLPRPNGARRRARVEVLPAGTRSDVRDHQGAHRWSALRLGDPGRTSHAGAGRRAADARSMGRGQLRPPAAARRGETAMSGLIRDCAQGIGGAATRAALIALALGAVATGACIAWGPASVGLG